MKYVALPVTLALLAIATLQFYDLRINLTQSLPAGIYRLSSEQPMRGTLAMFCLAKDEWVKLAESRSYLAPGSCPSGQQPLLKYVAALPGDTITITDKSVDVSSGSGPACRWPLTIRTHDNQNRILPKSPLHSGFIPHGMSLVLTTHPGSFDSRYFGLVPLASMTRVQPVFIF